MEPRGLGRVGYREAMLPLRDVVDAGRVQRARRVVPGTHADRPETAAGLPVSPEELLTLHSMSLDRWPLVRWRQRTPCAMPGRGAYGRAVPVPVTTLLPSGEPLTPAPWRGTSGVSGSPERSGETWRAARSARAWSTAERGER